jgi:hypothetical protein
MERAILHSDLNCFYASVEMMLDPRLRGKAVAVCGCTEDRHGIVLAKSEKAKRAGVKTGMVNWEAQRCCKDLIIVSPQYDQYLKYSNGLMDLWAEFRILDMGKRLGRFITHYRNTFFRPDKRNGQVVFSYKPLPGAEEQIYDAISDITISMKAVDHLDMPECVHNDAIVTLSETERKAYDAMKQDLVISLKGEEIDAGNAAALANKLSQMANGAVYGEDKRVFQMGFTVVPFGQGFKDMSPPTKELMKLVLEQRIAHGGHPVLRWMMDNIFIRTDPAGNIKPDKEKSTEKIDGAVATIMALDRAIRCGNENVESVYDTRGLLFI